MTHSPSLSPRYAGGEEHEGLIPAPQTGEGGLSAPRLRRQTCIRLGEPEEGKSMSKLIIRRRGLLKAGVAASAVAAAPSALRAQGKLAPPNIIKAGTLVM